MFGLCYYKDSLGVPGDNQYTRLFGIRVRDVITLIIGVYILSLLTKISYWKMFIYILILMVIFHRIFCVRTATDKLLFSNNEEYNTLLSLFYFIIAIALIYFMNRKKT
jgi:hypothetical protein